MVQWLRSMFSCNEYNILLLKLVSVLRYGHNWLLTDPRDPSHLEEDCVQ